jgi:trimeric autotransporter adhesin
MSRLSVVIGLVASAATQVFAQSFTVSTVAGSTRFIPGALATATPLRRPYGVAQDVLGNIYVADDFDNRVFRVGLDGKITPIAGTGEAGFSGDDGPAIDAQFNSPRAIRLDGKGNLFIADYNNNRVRKLVLATGIVTTIAGNGKVKSSGDNGPATQAGLDPDDIAVDGSGNVFIAEFLNDRIRKVAVDGTITTLAGSGIEGDSGDTTLATTAALDGPTGISVDAKGIVYFTDYYNDRVRMIDTKTGIINGFAGSGFIGVSGDEGLAIKAPLPVPLGTAIDSNGDVLILCLNNLRRVTLADGKIHFVAGNVDAVGFSGDGGLVTLAKFAVPIYVASAPNGDILLSDTGNFRVRRVHATIVNTVAGTSIDDGIPATTTYLNHPNGVAADGKGGFVIADTSNNRIRAVSASGVISNLYGTGVRGNSTGQLNSPNDVAFDASGNLFIADSGNHRILRIAQGSTQATVFAGGNGAGPDGDGSFALRAKLNLPASMIVDASGQVYISDSGNYKVRVVDTDGNISTVVGSGIPIFGGDNQAAKDAGVSPLGLAFDAAGNLLIADLVNNRIRKVDLKTKIISTVAGSGLAGATGDGGLATLARLNLPTSVVVDSTGTILVGDSGNHTIRAIKGTTITTVAGTGDAHFKAESGSSIGTNIDPAGIAIDRDGTVYFADRNNDRIRKLVPAKPSAMALWAGDGQSGPPGSKVTLSVRITEAGATPVAGVTVNFSVTSGTATLSATSALTDSNGLGSVQLTYGATQGAVKVSAISSGLTAVTFSLTVLPPPPPVPTISDGGLAGAGLSVPAVRAISSNGIASIFGSNFGAGAAFQKVAASDLVAGKVPTAFNTVCVDILVTRAPVFGASDTQINFQVPKLNPGATVTVKVISGCGTAKETASNGVSASVQESSPEFFYFANSADGKNPVAATDSITGAGIASASLFPGSAFLPAKPGQYVTIYATGFGLTNPAFGAGEFFAGLAPAAGASRVLLNGKTLDSANVLYVGATPSSPGLYQVNLLLPDDTPDGDLTLVIEVAGVQSPAGAFLTVKK